MLAFEKMPEGLQFSLTVGTVGIVGSGVGIVAGSMER